MEGSFHGLDTMFLAADGGYHHYQSRHAWEQERVAFSNRKDLRAHISRLADAGRVSRSTAAALVAKDARFDASAFWKGATYITIDDASRLQHTLFYGRSETTRVPSPNTPLHSSTIVFEEISALTPEQQGQILRFADEKLVQRVGDIHTRKASARIVSTTSENLQSCLELN